MSSLLALRYKDQDCIIDGRARNISRVVFDVRKKTVSLGGVWLDSEYALLLGREVSFGIAGTDWKATFEDVERLSDCSLVARVTLLCGKGECHILDPYYHLADGKDHKNPSCRLKSIFASLQNTEPTQEIPVLLEFDSFEDLSVPQAKRAKRCTPEEHDHCPRCDHTYPRHGTCSACGYPGLKSLPDTCPHTELYEIRVGKNAGKLGCLAPGCKALFDNAGGPFYRTGKVRITKGPMKPRDNEYHEYPTSWYRPGVYVAFPEGEPCMPVQVKEIK